MGLDIMGLDILGLIHYTVPYNVIGASLSEPHTSESNGGFFIYIYIYIYLFICRTYVVP